MTTEELDALPISTEDACLFIGDEDGEVFDARTGECWLVGWVKGQRVKRRAHA